MYPTYEELNMSIENKENLIGLAKNKLLDSLRGEGVALQNGAEDARFPVYYEDAAYTPAFIQTDFSGTHNFYFIRGTWLPRGCKFDRFVEAMRSSRNFDKVNVVVVNTGYLPSAYAPNVSS